MAGEVRLANQIISAVFGLLVIFLGSVKLTEKIDPMLHQQIAQQNQNNWAPFWKIPPEHANSFLIVIGTVEVVGGILVASKFWTPALGSAGSALLIAQFGAAVLTHVMQGEEVSNFTPALMMLALAVTTFALGFVEDDKANKKRKVANKIKAKMGKTQ